MLWTLLFIALPLLILELMIKAAMGVKTAMATLPESRQGLLGTSVVLGFVSLVTSLICFVSALTRSGHPLVGPMVVVCVLFSAAALLAAIIAGSRPGALVIRAELLQGLWLLLLIVFTPHAA